MTFLHSGNNSKINLSAEEMLEISQEISRNFTPCFSSGMPELVEKIRLSANELFDIVERIGRDFAPKASFNIPEITLLPVDPGHLYAYWSLGDKPEISISDEDQLTLRIYSQAGEDTAASEAVSWFDVAIDSTNAGQQVSLPAPVDKPVYSAAIGKHCADDGFIVFVHSNIIHAPQSGAAWQRIHQNSTYCQGKNASGQGVSKQA